MLTKNPKVDCYGIWAGIRERHFRHNPAPDDDTYWRRVLTLSSGERAVILAVKFSEQVHDGGFHQFFLNGGFRYAYATANGLERLGFLEMAKFLRRAIEIGHIPDPLPPGFEFDPLMPEEGGEDLMALLGKLSDEFYDAWTNRDWNERIIDYVRAHPEEFV